MLYTEENEKTTQSADAAQRTKATSGVVIARRVELCCEIDIWAAREQSRFGTSLEWLGIFENFQIW